MLFLADFMTGSYVLKERNPFAGTDFVVDSREIRLTGIKPEDNEWFILYGYDEQFNRSGAIIAERMRNGMISFVDPRGRHVGGGLYSPISGAQTVNPVGNWLSIIVDTDVPLYDIAETREGLKTLQTVEQPVLAHRSSRSLCHMRCL